MEVSDCHASSRRIEHGHVRGIRKNIDRSRHAPTRDGCPLSREKRGNNPLTPSRGNNRAKQRDSLDGSSHWGFSFEVGRDGIHLLLGIVRRICHLAEFVVRGEQVLDSASRCGEPVKEQAMRAVLPFQAID